MALAWPDPVWDGSGIRSEGGSVPRPRVLVASAFVAVMQPLASACAAAGLRAQGADVVGWDAHLMPGAQPEWTFDLTLLSVQQFEGLERGMELARRLSAQPGLLVTFGQYAQMNHRAFLDAADAVALDEPERIAAELAEAAGGSRDLGTVPALITRAGMRSKPPRRRISVPVPARDLFPSLVHYEAHHSPFGLMGNTLLSSPWMEDVATTDRGFWVEWTHPDRRVEDLWQERRAEAEGAGRGRCCVKC